MEFTKPGLAAKLRRIRVMLKESAMQHDSKPLQGFSVRRAACAAAIALALAFADPAVGQQIGAIVSVDADTFSPALDSLPACDRDRRANQASETISLHCDVGATSPSPNPGIDLFARVDPPITPGSFPRMRTLAHVRSNVSGPSPLAPYRSVYAYAAARFIEWIELGSVRPNSIEITFQLTGTLAEQQFVPSIGNATNVVQMVVQDGSWPLGGSFFPFASGGVELSTTFSQGNTTTTIAPLFGNPGDPSLISLGSGLYRLTIGPAFFENPSNTHIMVDTVMSSNATLAVYWFPSVTEIYSLSDFSNSLVVTDVNALNADSEDITEQAILGFASSTIPLPEPTISTSLIAPMLALGMLAQRRRASRGRRGQQLAA